MSACPFLLFFLKGLLLIDNYFVFLQAKRKIRMKMNRQQRAIALACIMSLPIGTVSAQQLTLAQQLVDDGHYQAASQSISQFLKDGGNPSKAENERAQALQLVCDYFLLKDGASDAISHWLSQPHAYHQSTAMANRLKVLEANLMVKEGKYDEALDVYSRCALDELSQHEYEEALICKAVAYLSGIDNGQTSEAAALSRVAQAEAILNSLNGCKTHQMDMVYYSAYANYVKGDYARALDDFGIVRNNSDYSNSANVYMADCYLHLGEPQKALSILNNQLPLAVIDKQEQYQDLRYQDETNRIRGEAYFDQKNYTRAIESLQRYCLNTEHPRRTALYKLGMSQFYIQEYQKAAPALSQSTYTATDVMAQSAWLNAGISYIHSGNKKQAQIAFQQASEMTASPELQEEALYNYALTLHEGQTMGFGESVGVFERFLNQFPKSQYAPSVSKHLTEVYFNTKNYKAALESINKIQNPSAEIRQAKQQVLYNLGLQEFNNGNYRQADTYTAQAIDLGSKEAQYLHGESAYRQGKYSQAVTDLKSYTASKGGTNYDQALYTLGYSQFKQKRYSAAKTPFQQFINGQHPSATRQQLADALNRYADCLYTERQYDEAYATYQRVIDTDPAQGDYAIYQQAFIEGLRGNYEKKVSLLDRLTSSTTGSTAQAQASTPTATSPTTAAIAIDALFEQGRAYVLQGNKQKALNTFTSLTQQYPSSQKARQALNEMAMIQSEMGNTEQALALYGKVINDYPNTTDAQTALSNLKNIYTQKGMVEEYASLAAKAGKNLSQDELDQMIADAAVTSMTDGKYAQAYKYYDQLGQQTSSAANATFAMQGKLRSSFAAKDYDANINAAGQILADAKSAPSLREEALLFRAESYLSKGNAPEGVKDLQALAVNTQSLYGAQGNVRLAQYAYDTQQYQAAEQLLTKFIDSGTPQQYWLARGFILLADVYAKTDRKVEAKEYLLSLKSNYSENEEINKMIADRLAKL